VTSSATSAPIEHVLVCALAAGGSESGCAVTNAGGEYTISALARGPFKVGFVAAGYALQFYDDAPSYAAARLVRLTAGETTAGIDAALTATPTPASPGAGATGAPSEIRRAARPALLTFTAARIVVSGGSAAAHVACRQAGCAGLLELATRVSARRRGEHPTSSARQQLVLARGSFSLSDGANATVILHLTGAGRRMLAHARHHPLAARLAARLKDGPAVSESVLVS
jgi:hypothetical protein